MNERVDLLVSVHRSQIVEVRLVSTDFEVSLFDTNQVFDVIHQDTSLAAMLLDVVNPMLRYLVIDVESHGIDEDMTSMMIQRLCLTMMFDCRTVLPLMRKMTSLSKMS